MWVARLREDLEKLVVGEEVHAREDDPLGLEIGLQALHDLVEEGVVVLECLEEAGLGTGSDGQRDLTDFAHNVLPGLVDVGEHLGLCGQLTYDVGRGKDGLQVEPAALALDPGFEGLVEELDLLGPFVDSRLIVKWEII